MFIRNCDFNYDLIMHASVIHESNSQDLEKDRQIDNVKYSRTICHVL